MSEALFISSSHQGDEPSNRSSDDYVLDAYSRSVTRVVDVLMPSVISLRVYRQARGRRQDAGEGSGVVISPDGFVVTSAHVVAGATRGSAVLTDGRELDAEVSGVDPLSDLAVVRVPGADLHPAVLGDADRLRVGQLVIAIGNPLGFVGSVTAGIVSALGRSIAARSGSVTRLVENVIQTDVALHPGNSGGALANSAGQVIGINTAVVGPAIGQGLGLAVPINVATKRIIGALMAEGRVRRAYVGFVGAPRPLPPRAARATGRKSGVEVIEVVPGSPAALAGLRPEDVLLEIDDVPVEDMGDLQRLMDSGAIGRRLRVRVHRAGRDVALEVVPVELTG